MATILLTDPIDFPIGPLRILLKEHAPHYRWQCGEFDEGGAGDKAVFDRPHLILGRSSGEIIMINAALINGPFVKEGVPPHNHHISISNPTIDDDHVADRLRLIICRGLTQYCNDTGMRCQLLPGGAWLDAQALREALALVTGGVSLTSLDTLGAVSPQTPVAAMAFQEPPTSNFSAPVTPAVWPSHFAEPIVDDAPPSRFSAPVSPSICAEPAPNPAPNEAGPAGLPSLIVMLEARLNLDWAEIGALITEIDPDGGWQVKCEPTGRGFLLGRGGMIALLNPEAPVAADLLNAAFDRSWWIEGDRAHIAAHRSQLIISSTIEQDAPFADKSAVARIMSLIACISAHSAGVTGVLNAGVGIVHEPEAMADMLATLAEGEIPIPIWTDCAWHGQEDGDVSLSTTGFAAFLGHEIEVWHAPAAAQTVQDTVSGLMRYLLSEGPVIEHGDTCGATEDGRAITCTHLDSRAERAEPAKALIITFGAEEGAAPAPPELAEPAESITEEPHRVFGGFGRKGL